MVKKTVTIKHPVTIEGKIYDSLTFDKFRTKHFRHMPGGLYEIFLDQEEKGKAQEGQEAIAEKEITREEKIQQMKLGFEMIPLIASICNVPEAVIDELEIDDMMEVMGAFNDFLSGSSLLTDGKK